MAESIANPEPLALSRALGRAAKLIRLLEEAGLTPQALQLPIDDATCRHELVKAWLSLVQPALVRANLCTLGEAAKIMGSNFHGPASVKNHLGINLGQAKQWKSVPFGAATLRALRNTHVLVAVPAVSIMDLHKKAPQALGDTRRRWYATGEVKSFNYQPCEPGWYLVSKEVLQESRGLSFDRQQALVQEPDFVPEANLPAYAWVIHFLDSGKRMFSGPRMRTSTVLPGGDRRLVTLHTGKDVNHPDEGYILSISYSGYAADFGVNQKDGVVSARRPL